LLNSTGSGVARAEAARQRVRSAESLSMLDVDG
jgi:hypothetical protein